MSRTLSPRSSRPRGPVPGRRGGYRQPRDSKDAIEILRQEEVLEPDLTARLKGWMGFRNVLVHLYLDTDHQRTYETIQHELGDLEAFSARMAGFLET